MNITPDTNRVIELIEKLSTLAERGEGAERDNAKDKLNKICLKYGIELIEIEGMRKTVRAFSYSNLESKSIIAHCIWDVLKDSEIQCDAKSKKLFVEINPLQYVEVHERYKHYWYHYKKERETFLTAFILKNNIGIKVTHGDDGIDSEDAVKLNVYMNTMNDNPYVNEGQEIKQLR